MKSSAARVIGGLALACWSSAWFLPVLVEYSGWDAFRAALQGPFRDSFPLSGEHAIAQILSALTNVAFVALFAVWMRDRMTRPALYLKLALLCLLVDLYWLVEMLRADTGAGDDGPRLLIGYYVWLAGFALLVALGALSAVSARRTSRTPTAGTPT